MHFKNLDFIRIQFMKLNIPYPSFLCVSLFQDPATITFNYNICFAQVLVYHAIQLRSSKYKTV